MRSNMRQSIPIEKACLWRLFRRVYQPHTQCCPFQTWHKGAAKDAQRWAESCQLLVHDNSSGRWVEGTPLSVLCILESDSACAYLAPTEKKFPFSFYMKPTGSEATESISEIRVAFD